MQAQKWKIYVKFFDKNIRAEISGDTEFHVSKADIRNPLRYLLMNAVASQYVSGSFQLPLT